VLNIVWARADVASHEPIRMVKGLEGEGGQGRSIGAFHHGSIVSL